MLWACDLNLVRGEDSLVRALWAGQPLVWHIYPQHDDAHHDKLHAFLDWLQAPASLRAFHHAWNGMAPASTLPAITPALLRQWQDCALAARALLQQTPLIEQLQAFVTEKLECTFCLPGGAVAGDRQPAAIDQPGLHPPRNCGRRTVPATSLACPVERLQPQPSKL